MKDYPKSDLSGYQVLEVGQHVVRPFIRSHYLCRWPAVVVACLALLRFGRPVGTIIFALPPRETMTRYKVKVAWELARLYILDSEPFNIETWFIARAIKWVKRNRPDVNLLVSYADPSADHKGTIYRAANWKFDGMTDPKSDYFVDGKKYSRRSHVPEGSTITRIPRVSKFRFIYPL